MTFEERLRAPRRIDETTAIIIQRFTGVLIDRDGTRRPAGGGAGVMSAPEFDGLPDEVKHAIIATGELVGYGREAYRRAQELCSLENGLTKLGVL